VAAPSRTACFFYVATDFYTVNKAFVCVYMYDDDLRFSGMAKWQNSVQTRIVALAARCGDVSQAYDSACSRTPNHA